MSREAPDATFAVRVLTSGGTTAGVGVLVAGRRVVTCAHVVNAALGRDPRAQDRPDKATTVEVAFPFAGLAADRARRHAARVVAWVPPPREGAAGDDIAGLELADGDAPPGVVPARLSVDAPRAGKGLRVFGYPGRPPRPAGAWVATIVRGRVGNGRIQLDSGPESSLKVQPGYSGGPVIDDETGRVVGIITEAPPGSAATERDSYAIDAAQLRAAWPQQLAAGRRRPAGGAAAELTVLHVSDPQFGGPHVFGGNGLIPADVGADLLSARLQHDLERLADAHDLRPDLMIVTGDLARGGLKPELAQAGQFLAALSEAAEIPRRHVAIVPGNHDVNHKACAAYFLEQESDGEDPVPPYWPKWRQFTAAFNDFYADVPGATFTPDEPWSFFEMPSLGVVVAGLNSTVAESHRDGDHYGQAGERQLQWFASRLRRYQREGWLRIAAVHHHVLGGAVLDEENLRDAGDLDRLLAAPGLVHLVLHGHAQDAELHWLPSGVPALSTGSAAVQAAARPAEVPNQYQLITIRRDGFTRHARQYSAGQHRWIGDTRISAAGSDWHEARPYPLTDVDLALPLPRPDSPGAREPAGGSEARFPSAPPAGPGQPALPRAARERRRQRGPGAPDTFLDLVAQATRARRAESAVDERPEHSSPYLRVSQRVPTGATELWPVGVIDGPVTREAVLGFITGVHEAFAAGDPGVRSELVARAPAPAGLVELARQRGVRLRSFTEYQGLVDLTGLAARQREQLSSDPVYPGRLYVAQRFTTGDRPQVQAGLVEQAVRWLSEEDARLIVVLGDFGRGKTSFLRQLTRRLPDELPGLQPILVELRTLEKAPTLDELLAQHLVRNGVEDVNPRKLRYMISSGRLALLFDGFDELELRVGYDNAADYLQTLLDSVSDRAKVILTSRTQHFRDLAQVRTALGEKVEAREASRVVVLQEFTNEQVLEFLTRLYADDAARARARFDLISDIANLLELAHNPRMLAFVAALDTARLEAIRELHGSITQAELYREIIDYWLTFEERRQQHEQGLPSLSKADRLRACAALAHRLWASASGVIYEHELSAEVTRALTNLAELGYTEAQASHAIASGSLLVRTDEGGFRFIHQSVMEWLVADAAAAAADPAALGARRMSSLMTGFYIDLIGLDGAENQARRLLADASASQIAKQNALYVLVHARLTGLSAMSEAGYLDLSGMDLRGADLTNLDLGEADLTAANLEGLRLIGTRLAGARLELASLRDTRMTDVSLAGAWLAAADLSGARLANVDLAGAQLGEADLRHARLTGGSLAGAMLGASNWAGAAIVGTAGVPARTATAPELGAAAIAGLDQPQAMIRPMSYARSVAFSPGGDLIAVGAFATVELLHAASTAPVRVLHGHAGWVSAIAFSPDGALLATASSDGTGRLWDTATGELRHELTGHFGPVSGIAFAPDGGSVATVADDGTARTWDAEDGRLLMVIPHEAGVNAVAFSPDGSRIATATSQGIACLWRADTGRPLGDLSGHEGSLHDIAFSPDGSLIATASAEGTARIWDTATGSGRTILGGHAGWVYAARFSPDGSMLATASGDGGIRIWDPAHGRMLRELRGHSGWAYSLAFSPDGRRIASAANDRTARLWDIDGSRSTRLTPEGNPVRAVAFSPDGASLATGSSDGTLCSWDLATGVPNATFGGRGEPVHSIAHSPEGTLIGTDGGGVALVGDVATGRSWTLAAEGDGPAAGVASPPAGPLTASRPPDRMIPVRDSAARLLRWIRAGQWPEVTSVAFSRDGNLIATTSGASSAQIWDVQSGLMLSFLDGHRYQVNAAAFSPDGTLIATGSSDATVIIWEAPAGRRVAQLHGHDRAVTAVAFSPDGTRIATGSSDNCARIWQVATGEPTVVLPGHLNTVNAVAFSPDGSLLATGADDATTRIWDLATATTVATLLALPDGGYATLLPDGSYKLDGDPADHLWWAIKLCRFEAGELDPYVPGIRRLAPGTPVLPARPGPEAGYLKEQGTE